ncbi:MAG: bL17 family ribosomal protein [Phascolarctobacterium faecium]
MDYFKTRRLACPSSVLAVLVDEEATRKLFDEIAPKYAERQGGFTRIYRVDPRHDAAEMKIIELV